MIVEGDGDGVDWETAGWSKRWNVAEWVDRSA